MIAKWKNYKTETDNKGYAMITTGNTKACLTV